MFEDGRVDGNEVIEGERDMDEKYTATFYAFLFIYIIRISESIELGCAIATI